MRRWWIVGIVILVLVAIAGTVAFVYEPLAVGSVSGRDDRLLINTRPISTDGDDDSVVYTYQFHAGTSYYTLFSVRNEGPLAITINGIDPNAVMPMSPTVGPADLRFGSSREDPFGMVAWDAARPFARTVVEPATDLALWIRWEIGPCSVGETMPYMVNSGIVRSSIPLSWSVLSLPRTTDVDLGYTVAFEVRPAGLATQCEPAGQ
jgi:hypothetical protein